MFDQSLYFPKKQPQDPSAFLKAMLKIPDVNAQTNKQQSKHSTSAMTLQKAAVSQKDQTLNPPPLVQQMFDVCLSMSYCAIYMYMICCSLFVIQKKGTIICMFV